MKMHYNYTLLEELKFTALFMKNSHLQMGIGIAFYYRKNINMRKILLF